MPILLINLATTILLTFATLYLVSGLLKFWRSVAMMQSMYLVSQNMDTNQRSNLQYNHLGNWLVLGSNATTQIAFSIGAFGVIIVLRLIAGAFYANL